MTRETPDYDDAEFAETRAPRPKHRTADTITLTARAVLEASAEIFAEQKARVDGLERELAALRERLDVVERGAKAAAPRLVPAASGSMIA
jgi:hypothetical protein